jgi:glycosyltransferase involved in cell wall biosynthesis
MHVLHTFANNDSVPYLSWFAERAQQEGGPRYSFLVLHPKRPAMMDEMQALGLECKWIKFDARSRKRDMVRALPLMWWHFLRTRPDIVHCNLFDDSLPGVLAAWLAGVKVRITTKQDTGFHWVYTRQWVRFDRLITRLSTLVIAISEECRRFLIEKERAPAEKIALVHNGIPAERFTQQESGAMDRLRRQFSAARRYPVIGTVARFIPWKGYVHIVDAARIVVARHPEALFLFCGMGEQQEHIRQLVKAAELDEHVVFTGWVERSEMASFYGILDVYLHAATLEPFGLVYAEAMMNGVPVVSTCTGAALDAIEDGRNGILVNEADGKELAEGVERLMRMDLKAVGEAGRATALRMFSFDVMWKGTTAVYRLALERRK